jgi:DNA-binding Lrp family transcriptional regulator
MDAIDESIIALLRKDAKMSYVSIGKQLDTTEGTIRSRVKRLQADGVIKSFTIKTASKNIKALIEVKIEVNVNTSEISGMIRQMPEVESVYEVSGDADIIAIVDVMTTDEMNTVIERIRGLGPTLSTETRLILQEL